jgi:hypothetical protein
MNQLSLPLVVIGIAISSPLPAAMVFNPDEDIMTSAFFFPPNSVRGYAGEGRDVFRVSNNDAFGLTGAETIYLSFQSADLSSYANPIDKAILTMTSVDGGFNANASGGNPFTISAHAVDTNPITSITDDTNPGGTIDWLTFYNLNIQAASPESSVAIEGFGQIEFDVTSIVNDWISGTNNELTIALTGKNDISGTDFLHGFLNNTETPGSTFLTINPIPEPTSGILALVGLALTLGRRSRQS